MKKLLFFLGLMLLVLSSCDKDEVIPDITPVHSKEYKMNNGTSIDTLYYSRGEFSSELVAFNIYSKNVETNNDRNATAGDTVIRIGDKIRGRAEFHPNTYVKRIEMYDWFTLSEINVDGQKAFEVRSTGTNPDSLQIVISVDDKRLDGELFYIID